ncbi:ACP phosphodiesterase [Dysgonomonas sp. OttesenSCG-928-M03]|nr:ACP phosphodiesterase [Dysgonomonas sp. OttesenSCG-928-M03]
MNYLAHAYLSFDNPHLLVGNMVADFVRGKQMYDFREEVQEGIRLHRQIDEYTDHHPVALEIKKIFDSSAGRYNASFLDVSFDHFLATDQSTEPAQGWKNFAKECYEQIDSQINDLPKDFRRFFSYMKKENWLYNYRYKWMIEKSFTSLTQRAKYLENNVDVYSDFENNYDLIQDGYNKFFPQLKKFAKEYIDKNIHIK